MAQTVEQIRKIAQKTATEPKKEAIAAKTVVTESLEDDDNVDESKLPFPKATIVNMLRKNLSAGKQIKGQAKTEMNLWLGKMVERVAAKLNAQPYSYVDGAMFRQAIETYENVQDIEKEKERITKQLESIKAACDVLILEVDRKFVK